jgi:hypothetical protein
MVIVKGKCLIVFKKKKNLKTLIMIDISMSHSSIKHVQIKLNTFFIKKKNVRNTISRTCFDGVGQPHARSLVHD